MEILAIKKSFIEWLKSSKVHTAPLVSHNTIYTKVKRMLTLTESKIHNHWYDAREGCTDCMFYLTKEGFTPFLRTGLAEVPTKTGFKKRGLL